MPVLTVSIHGAKGVTKSVCGIVSKRIVALNIVCSVVQTCAGLKRLAEGGGQSTPFAGLSNGGRSGLRNNKSQATERYELEEMWHNARRQKCER